MKLYLIRNNRQVTRKPVVRKRRVVSNVIPIGPDGAGKDRPMDDPSVSGAVERYAKMTGRTCKIASESLKLYKALYDSLPPNSEEAKKIREAGCLEKNGWIKPRLTKKQEALFWKLM